ncbi:hypothetical protein [Vulcanisaeta distributa]|uniref:hypothetical protein n=1 Tax=Vulcanisaeta distributa TaxID=164451 RepID=UPI001FB1D2A2|nr:hypothetical protein [Vulcanisaeta distributa]
MARREYIQVIGLLGGCSRRVAAPGSWVTESSRPRSARDPGGGTSTWALTTALAKIKVNNPIITA